MRFLSFIFCVLFVLSPVVRSGKGISQYCHRGNPQTPFIFCTAISTWSNSSSEQVDWWITFGYQRRHPRGWAAIGVGDGMYGALIFVSYTDKSSPTEPLLSVRHGSGYFEPRPVASLPVIRTSKSSVNDTGWVELNFVCFGCGRWGSQDPATQAQSWIWAVNTIQSFDNASASSTIQKHGYYGYFHMDMSEAQTTSALPTEPHINPNLENKKISGGEGSSYATVLLTLHGIVLAICCLVVFPFGVVAMRRSTKSSFKTHLCLQVSGTISCVIGVSLAIYAAIATHRFDALHSLHSLTGVLFITMLLLQNLLGYSHHKAFKSACEASGVRLGHIWLGRTVIPIGFINVVIGLRSASISAIPFISILAIICFDAFVLCLYPQHDRIQVKAQERDFEEHAQPFLENGSK